MKITALRLHNVRRFAGRGIAIENIGDGVNVLCEANEYGKSTCFDSLHALFFQSHSGTPGFVQALRPYSGGSPLIEADIRLRKQFYGGKLAQVTDLGHGRLIAQADEAEAFIRQLVRGDQAGPAGLLWVRQGNTGLDRKAKSDEESEKQARETVLTSVQGEVESVTGGRRMRAVMEACESELSKLVTTTYRPKASGPFDDARNRQADLNDRVERLQADVTALHDALEERRQIRDRLRELDDLEQMEALRVTVEEADKQLVAAERSEERKKAAQAELSLKQTQYDKAVAERDVYIDSLNRNDAVKKEIETGEATRQEVITRRDEARDIHETAVAAVETAERTERQARDHLAALEKARRAHEAVEKLTGVRETLEQAETLRDEIDDLDAKVRALDIAQQDVDAIEQFEQYIARLRAIESVRATTVQMAYDAGVSPSIGMDDGLLQDQTERPLAGTARLTLPGMGVLTIRPPDAADGSQFAKMENDYRQRLEALGLDSLSAVRQRQEEVRGFKTAGDIARQKLAFLAPDGLDALHEAIAALEAAIQVDASVTGNVEEARAEFESAGQAVVHARLKSTETRPASEQAVNAVIAAEAALAVLRAEQVKLDAFLGEVDTRAGRANTLKDAVTHLQAEHQAALTNLDLLLQDVIDLENAQAALRRARSVLKAREDDRSHLLNRQSELNGQINAQSGQAVEEELQEAREQLQIVETQVSRFEHEVALLRKLKDTLVTAKSDAREHYFEPVMTELRPLLNLLFDDARVTFDDETLLPRTIHRNGQEEQVLVLSGGMREQLAILTRLAFARLLAREGRPAPVVLDDALVYSDDDRIEKMFNALHRQAREQQIIVFSCRQRAFSLLGGNRLRLADWAPTG